MAYKLIWAPSAQLDLKEISSYIAESRPGASPSFNHTKDNDYSHPGYSFVIFCTQGFNII